MGRPCSFPAKRNGSTLQGRSRTGNSKDGRKHLLLKSGRRLHRMKYQVLPRPLIKSPHQFQLRYPNQLHQPLPHPLHHQLHHQLHHRLHHRLRIRFQIPFHRQQPRQFLRHPHLQMLHLVLRPMGKSRLRLQLLLLPPGSARSGNSTRQLSLIPS